MYMTVATDAIVLAGHNIPFVINTLDNSTKAAAAPGCIYSDQFGVSLTLMH
jgi:hypothetical protein